MCRNIKTLFKFEPPVTTEEIEAASLQFVRKISGFNKPSKANEAAFQTAVGEITQAATRLLNIGTQTGFDVASDAVRPFGADRYCSTATVRDTFPKPWLAISSGNARARMSGRASIAKVTC